MMALDVVFDFVSHVTVVGVGLAMMLTARDSKSSDALAVSALGGAILLLGVALMTSHFGN